MSLFKRSPLRKIKSADMPDNQNSYIDLGEMTFEDEAAALSGAQTTVRVAEVYRYEDINQISSVIYDGDLLFVDITSVSGDDLTLRRVTSELRNIVKDTGGDVAAIAKNLLLVTPKGIRIDRTKIRPSV